MNGGVDTVFIYVRGPQKLMCVDGVPWSISNEVQLGAFYDFFFDLGSRFE
jgi:hypothetical protein